MSARKYDINGWFTVEDNPISREGIFPYSSAQIGGPIMGKVYQVYRPASELSHPDTIDSFRLVPLIDDHTMLGKDGQPAEHVGIEGVIGEQIRVGADGVMRANLKILSNTLAQKIKSGKTQLSCGYRCVYDFTPGVWNGQAYDAVQRQIRGNHIALVDEGRMGPLVAILDHMTFTVDAKEHKPAMDEEIKKALDAINEKMGTALDTLNTRLDQIAADAAEMAAKMEAEEAAGSEDSLEDLKEKEEAAKGMDAVLKKIADLEARVAATPAMDEASILSTIARKSSLADQLAKHVGTFDHSTMSLADVVKYGVDKLGLKNVPAGGEAIALDAALQVRAIPSVHVVADSKTSSLGQAIAARAAGV